MRNIFKFISIFVILISLILFYTFLGYKNIINLTYTLNNIVSIIIGFIFSIVLSYNINKRKQKNGILNGIFVGLIIITSFIIIKLLTKTVFLKKDILKYSVYLLSSIIGGIIGVNKRQVKIWSLVFFILYSFSSCNNINA